MAEVMDETFAERALASRALQGIWEVMDILTKSEVACDLAIMALMQIRRSVDGASHDQILREVQGLREAGQKEYARNEEDAFRNFRKISKARFIGIREVLVVYLCKHLDGIGSWLDGHQSQREGVEGRINDAIVYLVILKGMIRAGAV